jgi:hypothetical protein
MERQMATMFKDYTEGRHPNLKFAPGLVLGWLTEDFTSKTETRYALFADGRVLRAEPVSFWGPGSDDFSPKGRKWTKVEAIPANAEFIGHYHPPVRAFARQEG